MNSNNRLSLLLSAIFISMIIIIPPSLYGQNGSDWFSFDIPPLDTAYSEYLPQFDRTPIGPDDFVTVSEDGHFEVNGEPIRFWGTPCSRNESASPDKEDYPKMVSELRKHGVNVVRFHLWDSRYFNPQNSIFGTHPGTRTLDEDALDRIHYLVYLMKQNGIYVYMDLLCDRAYTQEDGVHSPDSTYYGAKLVNFFDPYLISLQKEYAAQLLTHVSPYTGLALVDEPAMAFIDIVNEGWFLHEVRGDRVRPVSEGGKLSQYHFDMLTDQWNEFLIDKYNTETAIKDAWGIDDPVPGNEVQNGGFESWMQGWSAWGPQEFTTEVTNIEALSGANSFHVYSSSPTANSYECQLQHDEEVCKSNITYRLTFWAKSSDQDNLDISIQLREAPWTTFASAYFNITGNWKEYTTEFNIQKAGSDQGFLKFNLGHIDGDVFIDEIKLEQIGDGESYPFALLSNEDVTNNEARKRDQAEFYMELQNSYYAQMMGYLKDELGVRIPVTGSNYLIGIPDVHIQNKTDFIDNHGYWATYQNPEPVSMIPHPEFYNPVLGLFAGLRVDNKPLCVSEYNYQQYNPFGYEALFFLTAYGSLHEADMLITHQLEYTPLWDFWNHGFNSYQQIAYRALQPTMAYAYRNGLISASDEPIDIKFSEEDVLGQVMKQDGWTTDLYPADYPFELALTNSVRTAFNSGSYDRNDYPATPTNPYTSDTEEITWDKNGLVSIDAPQIVAMVGQLNAFHEEQVGLIELVDADKSAGLTLVALDNRDLTVSRKMLLTLVTRMKNSGMETDGWNIIDYGHHPRIVEATDISIDLTTSAEFIKLSWLNEQCQFDGDFVMLENNGDGQIL